MVTLLVCLVVVGGAVVTILWLTLEDGEEPATEAVRPHRGVRSARLASTVRRASAYLVPTEATAAHNGARQLLAPVGPTLGTVALEHALGDGTGEQGGAAAPPAADTARGDDAPAGRLQAEPAPSTVARHHAEAGTAADLSTGEPAGLTLATVAPEHAAPGTGPGASTGQRAAGADRPAGAGRRPARRPRPSFARRTLRRARGAVGLVVLLVGLGTMLAVTLVGLAAMLVVGVRAAVGT